MNTFLQISLALIPVEIVFVLLAIFRKKQRIVPIITAVILSCCIGAAVFANFRVEPETTAKITKADTVEQLDLIYSIAGEKDGIPQASQLLTQLRKNAQDSAQITMCDAYLCAAEGDWRSALILYSKAVSLGETADPEFLKVCNDAKAFAMKPLSEQSGESGISRLQNFTVKTLAQRSKETSESTAQAAKVLLKSQALFDQYLATKSVDSDTALSLSEELCGIIEEEETVLTMEEVRNCRTKLWVMSGQYRKIAENIGNDSTYIELAIAAELYMNKLIKDDDFGERFIDTYKAMLTAVSKQLQQLQDKISDKESRQLISALRDKLTGKEPTVLRILADHISAIAGNLQNANKPKAHIQLAKISYKTNDTADAKMHLSAALGSAGVSDDQAFYGPMQQISRIINEKTNYSELKNLSGYVDQMLENASDPVATAIIQEARQNPPADSTEEDEDADEEASEEISEADVPFETFVNDSLNQFRISLDITNVDATNFSKVVATVNVDGDLVSTPEELKKLLKVTDCGVEITDFTVTKSEFSNVSIVLCCDVSLSMEGQPTEDLRNAVKLFAETASDKEKLALVTFTNGSRVVCPMGTDPQAISDAAAGLTNGYGTNIYGALIDSLKLFDGSSDGLKYILLMSDGEDGNAKKIDEIHANIGNPALENCITVYSLGIGNGVDLDYLSMLAGSTGGDFVHVQDSASLKTFYDSLRNQMLNQYFITFEAKDTLIVDRDLVITLKENESSFQDIAYYNLEYTGTTPAPSHREESIITVGSKGVYNLEHNVIFKSSDTTTIHINGFGFEADDSFSVKLDGDQDRDAEVSFVSSEKLAMVVPGNLAPGKYDVKISIGSLTTTIRNGLTVVVQNSLQLTEVGPYKFTSYVKTTVGNVTTLSGAVQLNGWLDFRGDITLQQQDGDVRQVLMTDQFGSYVSFHKDSAKGVAKLMANWDKKLFVPALGEVVLVAENTVDASSDDYPVNTKPLPALNINSLLALETPGVSLYPYRLAVKSDAFTTAIPGQENILKLVNQEKLFTFELAIGGSVSNDSIDIFAEYKRDADMGKKRNKKAANFGLAEVVLSTTDIEVLVDTANAHVKLDFFAKFGFMCTGDEDNEEGLGLTVEWKGRDGDTGAQFLMPSNVEVLLKKPIDSTIGPVPVTYNKFFIGVEDVDLNEPVYNWTLKGGCSIGTKKLSSFIPGLAEFLDDPSILSIDPAEIKLNLGKGYFGIEATLKLLDEIELANAQIEAGKISVDSALLGFSDETALGLRGELSAGLKWHITNCDVDIGGSCTLHLHSKFLGAEVEGHANVAIGWSIFKATWNEQAYFSLGIQRIDDIPSLIIRIAASDNTVSDGYYFMWNTKTNLEYGRIDV